MDYFARALLAAVIIGGMAGLVGALVVLRRRVFFAQALTHATFPGAVAAAALGISVPLGAAVASVLIVGVMLLIGRVRRQGEQVAAGIVLTAGFALGMTLQAVIPGLPVRVDSFLVGSILTTSDGDIALAGAVFVVTIVALVFFGKQVLFSTVDPDGYRATGHRTWPVEGLVLALMAAAVVAALPAVGAILAIALIAAPASAARLVARGPLAIVIASPLIGAASGVIGVILSRTFSIAAGPSIALTACAFFVLALLLSRLRAVPWRMAAVPTETAEEARTT
ncbi:metal ABC transporter permease [Agromyces atrinae]|uniref:Manganese/iron transport system permease protein n=1 Tax=Agromyces atrinae TaxID=592376 RepID=A0A4Q2M6X0_9MICO|nr:metal ABC transporter permease [Agromyces atrinae]NYD67875.1 manganese/iron transport system permease protein [Agromyces atrinae]RXZ87955.1 metal ABC transporter permease [Agromyces atrinae]